MNYTSYFIIILILCILIDISIPIVRLKISGVKALYKMIFSDTGYLRREGVSIEKTGSKSILIVGDSTAVGPLIFPEDTIAGRLADTFNINVVNLSKNGSITREIMNQVEHVAGREFYLTIIHAGNNDIWQFTDLKKLKKDISCLLDKTKMISERVVLFRGGNIGTFPIFPRTIGWIFSIRSKQVRDLFMSVAEEKSVLYVEKYMERKDDVFLKAPHFFTVGTYSTLTVMVIRYGLTILLERWGRPI